MRSRNIRLLSAATPNAGFFLAAPIAPEVLARKSFGPQAHESRQRLNVYG